MEGFNNPGFDVGRETKPTHPIHGLLKSANPFLLHRIPPTRPLSINTKISSSYLDRRKKTGTPGPLKLVFGVRAIADDHCFLR
eukprot:623294-Amphidinium_carterae.1